MSPEELDKMDACRNLLEPPAPQVVGELIAEIRRLNAVVKTSCDDWASDHARLQQLAREAGCTELQVEGNSDGVPGILDLHESIAAALRAERDALRKALEVIDTFGAIWIDAHEDHDNPENNNPAQWCIGGDFFPAGVGTVMDAALKFAYKAAIDAKRKATP